MHGQIATSSIDAGLDFACNLVASTVVRVAEAHPERAKDILSTLAGYISLRYAGEEECAFDILTVLGKDAEQISSFRKEQFWSQMTWLAKELNLTDFVVN